ncbi:adenylyl-sulfate kinase [Candidatus Pelagibacter sp.]|nr:adenylyl-sulfate kinase [Candidatus Pelagibacter sp.]
MVIWITGISASGKSTFGKYFFKKFKKIKKNTIFFDGDEFRKIFHNDIKYTLRDRDINAIRLTSLVKYVSDQKTNLIVSANITSQKFRDWCKKNVKNYFEIFIDTPIEVLRKRDYKKLYKNAFSGKIKNVVGVDIKFIKPKKPDLIIDNSKTKKDLYLNYSKILKEINNKKIKIY